MCWVTLVVWLLCFISLFVDKEGFRHASNVVWLMLFGCYGAVIGLDKLSRRLSKRRGRAGSGEDGADSRRIDDRRDR